LHYAILQVKLSAPAFGYSLFFYRSTVFSSEVQRVSISPDCFLFLATRLRQGYTTATGKHPSSFLPGRIWQLPEKTEVNLTAAFLEEGSFLSAQRFPVQ
jgi:hypothetical protein